MHRLQHRTHLAVCLGFGWFCPGLEQRKGKEGKGKGEKRKKSKRGAPDTALSLPTSMLGGSGASSPCRVVIPCSGDQLQELPPTSPAALQVPTRGHEAGAPLLGRSLRCPAPRCWWDPAQHLQQPMERSCLKPCSSEPHAPPAHPCSDGAVLETQSSFKPPEPFPTQLQGCGTCGPLLRAQPSAAATELFAHQLVPSLRSSSPHPAPSAQRSHSSAPSTPLLPSTKQQQRLRAPSCCEEAALRRLGKLPNSRKTKVGTEWFC